MRRVNQNIAAFLLAIFLVGGMAAPLVHEIQHAHEQHLHEQQSRSGASGHVHSHQPGLSEAPRTFVHLEVGCFLCSGLSGWTVQKQVSIIPGRLTWTIQDVPDTPSLPSVPLLHRVRGPPLA